jgi:hypothetical protein
LRWVQPSARLIEFLSACEVLAFRWLITNGNAQELETIFQGAASKIRKSAGRLVDDAQSDLVARIPSDEEFRTSFRAHSPGQIYVGAYGLRKFENALVPFSGKSVKGPSDVNLEHVIPKKKSTFWESRTGAQDYDEVVARWGNLTLLVSPVNQAIQNGDWSTKLNGTTKYPGYKSSDIAMTKDLSMLPDWSVIDVELRSRWLAVLAVRVWSLAGTLAGVPTEYTAVRSNPSVLDPFDP